MRLSYEALHDNPELLRKLLADARRERADAVHAILFAPLARLFRPQPATPCPSSASPC